jgi:hypothetical protein
VRALNDLLNTNEGLVFLEAEGVHVDRQTFIDQLRVPLRPDLASDLGADQAKLVCSGQQIYVDYRQSVVGKVEALRDFADDETVFPFFVWVDTDRSGADNLISKLAWPPATKKGAVSILPPGKRDVELRFAELDDSVLLNAIDKLGTSLHQSEMSFVGAKARYALLRPFFADNDLRSLAEFNLHLSNFLLTNVCGYAPPPLLLSDCLQHCAITDEVDAFLNCLPDVIAAFNEAVAALAGQDIDPQVKPLADDYVPFHYSCDDDGRRLRMSRHVESGDHYAVARCKCGRSYKFHLGNGDLSLAALAETERWSLDVCFPIFFNDLISGFVAGKSSTLYLIVMNNVLRRVLDKTPVPIMATVDTRNNGAESDAVDSLIYRYLSGESY